MWSEINKGVWEDLDFVVEEIEKEYYGKQQAKDNTFLTFCPGTEDNLESLDVKQKTIEDNRQMTQGMFSYSIE